MNKSRFYINKDMKESFELIFNRSTITTYETKLVKYYKKLLKSNGIQKVSYHQGNNSGRYHQMDFGFQGLKRCIRDTLCYHDYYYIDIKNAWPTLLNYYCKLNDIKVPQLNYYVDNRDEVISKLKTNWNKNNTPKHELLEIICSAKRSFKNYKKENTDHFDIKEFYYEMQEVQKFVYSKEKWSKKKPRLINNWGNTKLNDYTIYDQPNNSNDFTMYDQPNNSNDFTMYDQANNSNDFTMYDHANNSNDFTMYDQPNNSKRNYSLNVLGSSIVYLLSSLENYCMMIIYDYFLSENIIPAALIFDGMMIYKESQGKIFNETYLEQKLRYASHLINTKFHKVTGKNDINLNIVIELKDFEEYKNLQLNK